MSVAERKAIYTEKIHHITCQKCRKEDNTMDDSHEMDKVEAVIHFQSEGWKYIKAIGWLCSECNQLSKE